MVPYHLICKNLQGALLCAFFETYLENSWGDCHDDVSVKYIYLYKTTNKLNTLGFWGFGVLGFWGNLR